MAEVNYDHIVGNFTARVSRDTDRDSPYGKLAARDTATENAGHAEMHAFPASFFVWSLYILTTVGASSSGDSVKVKAPRPLTIWAADLGCESAGGATGTVDLKVANASVLDAAQDVKTGAGTVSRVAPEDGSEDVAYDATIHLTGASGGGGSLVGAQGHLYCQWQ